MQADGSSSQRSSVSSTGIPLGWTAADTTNKVYTRTISAYVRIGPGKDDFHLREFTVTAHAECDKELINIMHKINNSDAIQALVKGAWQTREGFGKDTSSLELHNIGSKDADAELRRISKDEAPQIFKKSNEFVASIVNKLFTETPLSQIPSHTGQVSDTPLPLTAAHSAFALAAHSPTDLPLTQRPFAARVFTSGTKLSIKVADSSNGSIVKPNGSASPLLTKKHQHKTPSVLASHSQISASEEPNSVNLSITKSKNGWDRIDIEVDGKIIGSAHPSESTYVSSARKGEKFYCLKMIELKEEFQTLGYGRKAFEKICNHYIKLGYSINLHEVTPNGVGARLYGGEKTRNSFDVSLETKRTGSWYIIRKKTGDTKPLEYLRIPEEDRNIVLWDLFYGLSDPSDKANLCGFRSLIAYLKEFPKEAIEAGKVMNRSDAESDPLRLIGKDEKLQAERTALRKEAFDLIWPKEVS